VELRKAGLTERQVAAELAITQPAVQKAIALNAIMQQMEISDPYLPVTEPPPDYKRFAKASAPALPVLSV
jgi:hypothetical protein